MGREREMTHVSMVQPTRRLNHCSGVGAPTPPSLPPFLDGIAAAFATTLLPPPPPCLPPLPPSIGAVT